LTELRVFWTTVGKGGKLTGQPHGHIPIRRNELLRFKGNSSEMYER